MTSSAAASPPIPAGGAFEKLRDLFDLPERVVKSDFVVKLHEGIQNEEATLKNYVATPRVVDSFDTVLSLIKRALGDVDPAADGFVVAWGSEGVVEELDADGHATWRATADLGNVLARVNWNERLGGPLAE